MKLGIAFAGGGLKGVAYIGVIKALEELGIQPEFISGTSSGSLFAASYAMGIDSKELANLSKEYYKTLTKIDKKPIAKAVFTYITSGVAKIEGLIDGVNISNLIQTVADKKNIKNMNELKTNLAICTVDTISTNECIFLSKKCNKKLENVDYIYDAEIAKATRASMSFPGVFTPCKFGKYNFIDGGTTDNYPTRILKTMGADKVIGLHFRLDDYKPKADVFAVLLRAVDIFSLGDVRSAEKYADLSIEIDAKGTSLLVIDDFDKLIETGYKAIMDNKENILKLCEL